MDNNRKDRRNDGIDLFINRSVKMTEDQNLINEEWREFKIVFTYVYNMVEEKAGYIQAATSIDSILGAAVTVWKGKEVDNDRV